MFANAMHANQLKNSCYEFVCFNLASQLYSRLLKSTSIQFESLISLFHEFSLITYRTYFLHRTLEKLDDTLLNELAEYYRNKFRPTENLFRNPLHIPVYQNACKPEDILNAEHICPVDWEAINGSLLSFLPFNNSLSINNINWKNFVS